MNCRVYPLVILLAWGLSLCAAWGQLPPAASSLTLDQKTAPDASAFRDQIQSFISNQVKSLNDADPAIQKNARQTLIGQVIMAGGGGNISPSFLDVYADELNKAILGLLKSKPLPTIRARLNAAIVVTKVAEQAQNTQLNPVILVLMNDPEDHVAMWGMNAAKFGINAVLAMGPNGAGQDPLIDGLLPAAQKHPKSGLVAEAAYRAIVKDRAPIVIPIMQDLLAWREQQYLAGLPNEPEAEMVPASFLSNQSNRTVQTARTVQLFSDLLSLASQQAAVADKDNLADLVLTIQRVAQALAVIAGDDNVNSALDGLMHPTSATTGAQELQRSQAAFGPLKAKFTDLQPPPIAKPPSTAPTTIPSPAGSSTTTATSP